MIPDKSKKSNKSYLHAETVPYANVFQPNNNGKHSMNNSYGFISCHPISSAKSSQLGCNYPIINQNNHNMQKKLHLKRSFFTEDEDRLLSMAAIKYNQSKWNLIAQCVPGKTPKQCRDRWANYLQPSLKFEPWSQEEDELLLSLVSKNGTRWSQLTSHFPNRSTNSVKNRWYWLIKNKGKDKLSKNTAKSRLSNSKRSSKCDCTDSLGKNNDIDYFHEIIPNNIQYNPFNYGICSPNFYYDITDNTSEKNNYSLENKGNPNYFYNTSNNQNIYAADQKINQNVVELKPHINSNFIPSEDDEIITFSPEELNW